MIKAWPYFCSLQRFNISTKLHSIFCKKSLNAAISKQTLHLSCKDSIPSFVFIIWWNHPFLLPVIWNMIMLWQEPCTSYGLKGFSCLVLTVESFYKKLDIAPTKWLSSQGSFTFSKLSSVISASFSGFLRCLKKKRSLYTWDCMTPLHPQYFFRIILNLEEARCCHRVGIALLFHFNSAWI